MTDQAAAESLVNGLLRDRSWKQRIVHVENYPARDASLAAIELSPVLVSLLRSRGIDKLYSHQAQALRSVFEGRNVAVTTPTASGKSLVYLLSLWEKKLAGAAPRALYLSPLKALAQDQNRLISELNASLPAAARLKAALYDGDTAAAARGKVRSFPPDIVLTNPDMVHLSVLPAHASWAKLLRNLKFVIIDEAHAYRGVFGMHVSGILRRLKRICEHYGSAPRFIVTSATISNPDEFLMRLTGSEFTVITESGAPTPRRYFMLVKPKTNVYTESCELLAGFLSAGLKTITFTKSRRITELLSLWLAEREPKMAKRVKSYRAGYLPEERRALEKALVKDELSGIISTSALELGIDIGGLDGCILVGFPGTMLSTWQRAGRVGRGSAPALVALVGMEDALDLYFLSHPGEFFSRKAERLLLDEANPQILKSHLVCAAAENPLSHRDSSWFGGTMEPLIAELVSEGRLFESATEKRWFSGAKSPQRHINIRSAGESFVIENMKGNVKGTVDGFRVFKECHPQAIYLHAGVTYEVVGLDLSARRVTVRELNADHYTQPVATEQTTVLKVKDRKAFGPGMLEWGLVRVTSRVVQYERHLVKGGALLSTHDLNLPDQEFETEGMWLTVPFEAQKIVMAPGRHLLGSLHALEHTSIALFPLFALCDRWDMGGISTAYHAHTQTAAVFIYDGVPGGIGLAKYAYEIFPDLLAKVAALIASCPCEEGCPSCIHSPKCGNRNSPLDKQGALALALEFLRDAGQSRDGAGLRESAGLRPAPAAAAPAAGVKAGQQGHSPVLPGHTLVFDLETQKLADEVGGWGNKKLMRISVAVVYDVEAGVFREYMEEDAAGLYEDLRTAGLVVGFNVKNFDYEVLSAYVPRELLDAVPTLDILEKVYGVLKRRIKLDDLAKATLGKGKLAESIEAVKWFRERDLSRLIEYCRNDVLITRDLFEFGRTNGFLLFDSVQGTMKLPVSW